MILSKSKILKFDPDALINNLLSQKKLDELLIIVPTNRKIRYLKRELISASPQKGLTKIHLHTFATYCAKLFDPEEISAARVLSEASSAVLLNKSFLKTELKYFSNYKNEIPRGTLERIKNVISKYKLNGISPEHLINESKKLQGSEKYKAADIANVYRNYLKLCKEVNAFEVGDIYTRLLSIEKNDFAGRFAASFYEVKHIIINGFDEFTIPEIEIINRTASLAGIDLFILFDYFRYNPALFTHLDDCYENFISRGFNEIEDISQSHFNDYHKRIREKLFLLEDGDKQIKSTVEIVKLAAQSPEEEIKLIAKEIKSLISVKGVEVESIAVCFNLISDHSSVIRDIFEEYGIPFNLTDRFALSESAPVIAIINFLEILENNFYYKNIFRALTGRWIKFNSFDLSNLLRVSSNLKIISGYTNWIETINRAIDEIEAGEFDDDNKFLPVDFYSKAKDDIQKIYDLLIPFKDKLSINDFKENLRSLLFEFNIPQKLVNDHSGYIEKNIKAVTVFLQTVDEVFTLLADEYGTIQKFPLSFFLSQIKTALQFTRFNIKERHSSGVLVTSVNELRGLKFDYVFIGGLFDGEFPTRYQPEIFYSGSFKENEYKHILENRYHFYQTLCCANKSVYLSFPHQDEKKEFTPSTFISDLSRIFTFMEKSGSDYKNLIYARSELLKYISSSNIDEEKEELEKFGINVAELKSQLSIDKQRLENPFGESVYSGYIGASISDSAKVKLAEQKEKLYSASQLEEYAKCPFQYFLKRILLLDVIKEPAEELESLELGSILHSILYEFYRTIKGNNIELANCSDKIFKQSEKLIFNIAEKKIEKLRLNSELIFYEKEKILGIAGNRKNSILYKFLESERANNDGFLPEYLEMEFGEFNKSDDNENNSIKVGDVRVRGKVDRIDIDKKGNLFKVIDYKLGGSKPSKKDLESGLSLQLPLYLYASKKMIEAELGEKYTPAEAIIYSLKLKLEEFGRRKIHISSSRNPDEDELIKSNKELIKICSDFIPAYVQKISEGRFNLSTLEDRDNKVCRFCDFKNICRIQELV